MRPFPWQDRWALAFSQRSRRTFFFSVLILFISMGFALGVESSTALLISRVGTGPLFYIYLGSSLLTFASAGLIYLLVDHFSRNRVFLISFEIYAACIFSLWITMRAEPQALWPYYAARIVFYAIFSLTLLQFWTMASDSFTNFEARWRYPIFVAASVAGTMVGSLLIQELATRFKAVNFFPLWALLVALGPLFLILVGPPPHQGLGTNRSSIQKKAGIDTTSLAARPSTRHLFYLLMLFWVAYNSFAYGVDYFFNSTSLKAIPDEDTLTSYFGKVGFLSLAVVFGYQVFFATRINLILGVNRSVGILCLLIFLAVGITTFYPSLFSISLAEGLLGFFVDFAAISLLEPVTNVFPDRYRGRMKVLIDGFGRPAGTLLLLLLALIVSQVGPIERLKEVLFVAAVLFFLLYPFFFQRIYRRYLLACLRSRDPHLVLNVVEALGERDQKFATPYLLELMDRWKERPIQRGIILTFGRMRSQKALDKVIQQFSVPEETIQLAVLESLSLYRNYESLFALYEFMKSQENVSFQVRMIATVLMTRWLGNRMIPLLTAALKEDDLRIQANAIESLALIKDPKIIPLVAPYLRHPNRRLRANAAVVLYPFRRTRQEARGVIETLFRSKDPLDQFAGIYAIGEVGLGEYRKALLGLLRHPDPRYGQKVITALARMGIPEFCSRFVDLLLLDPDEEVGIDAVRSLGRFSRSSRLSVFEKISRLNRAAQKKVVERLDKTSLDFSQEKELLPIPRMMTGPHPL